MFEDLISLKVLSLNSNKITSLMKCSFCSLNHLTLLNQLNNNIKFVDGTIFGNTKLHLILTDVIPVCCINSNSVSVCTAKPLWPSSCQDLLSNIGLKLACWSIGIIVALCNLLSIYNSGTHSHKNRKLTNYDKYIIGINISDLMVGLYLISIHFTDIIVGDNYVEIDLSWRASLPYQILGFISLLAILMSTFLMLGLSIERDRVIKYPLSGKEKRSMKTLSGKEKRSMKIESGFLILFVALLSLVPYIRYQVEDLSYLSSSFLLGKSGKSVAQNIVTFVVSFYLVLSLFIILILHYKMII